MNPFKIISFKGNCCGGVFTFTYKGETYVTGSKVLNVNLPDSCWAEWNVQNIRWAFVPLILTDYEKKQFVTALRPYQQTALNECKECCLCLESIGVVDMPLVNKVLTYLFGTTDTNRLREWNHPIKLFAQ